MKSKLNLIVLGFLSILFLLGCSTNNDNNTPDVANNKTIKKSDYAPVKKIVSGDSCHSNGPSNLASLVSQHCLLDKKVNLIGIEVSECNSTVSDQQRLQCLVPLFEQLKDNLFQQRDISLQAQEELAPGACYNRLFAPVAEENLALAVDQMYSLLSSSSQPSADELNSAAQQLEESGHAYDASRPDYQSLMTRFAELCQ